MGTREKNTYVHRELYIEEFNAFTRPWNMKKTPLVEPPLASKEPPTSSLYYTAALVCWLLSPDGLWALV